MRFGILYTDRTTQNDAKNNEGEDIYIECQLKSDCR